MSTAAKPQANGHISDEQRAELARRLADWDPIEHGPALRVRDAASAVQTGAAERKGGRPPKKTDAESAPVSPGTSDGPERRVTTTAASELEPERVRWLARHRVPLATQAILAGPPKLGKSTWARGLAADVSRGRAEGDLRGEPADVVILSYEDHPTATIVPGLMAADADLRRVHVLSPTAIEPDGSADLVTLQTDLDRIAAECGLYGARLLIIDPLMASLSGATDSHRDQDIRRALAPLTQLAERLGLTVLTVTHTTKAKDGDMIRRIGASVGLSGAARQLLIMGADPADPAGADGNRRILASRGNLAPPQPALLYEVDSCEVEHKGESLPTSRLRYLGESEVGSEELLSPPEPEERTAADDAADYLRAELANGPRAVKELLADAEGAGIAERTLRRAKLALGIEPRREGGIGGKGRWVWELPPGKGGQPSTHTVGSLSGNGSTEPKSTPAKASKSPKVAKAATPGDAGRLTPPCRYAEHRPTDYTGDSGQTICGTCHPPAGSAA